MSETIGQRIREIRKLKGLTQKQVAERCGMFDSAIRRYEADGANPKPDTLRRIAKALDVSISDLFDFSEEDTAQIRNLEKILSNMEEKMIMPGDAKETSAGDLSVEYKAVNDVLEEIILLPLAKEQAKKILDQNNEQLAQYQELKDRKEKEKELCSIFQTLNAKGQETAINRLKELAQLPDYQLKRRSKKQKE